MNAPLAGHPQPVVQHNRRSQLLFLDALRGVAALSVALYHCYAYSNSVDHRGLGGPVGKLLTMGQYGVPVFIVLSGFVLTLPVARTEGLTLKGGVPAFIRRRAKRILPPYYAALVLFTGLILLVPGLNHQSGTDWDSKIPVTAHAVLTHLLLIDNLGGTKFKIDGPMWSVASEWQIYFLLPLLLIPIWRRMGVEAAAIAALLIGIVLQSVIPNAHPIYLGLFALGAVAASRIANSTGPLSQRWRAASALLLLMGVLLQLSPHNVGGHHIWAVEGILGAGVACGLVHLVSCHYYGARSTLLGILSRPRLVELGLFSYSIYLIHSPLVGWMNLATRHISMPGVVRFLLLVTAGLPIALLAARAFFLFVERRFLSGHQAAVERSQAP
jgi:peptidoglycan/LPS O-acetylase OafA/YrhL